MIDKDLLEAAKFFGDYSQLWLEIQKFEVDVQQQPCYNIVSVVD